MCNLQLNKIFAIRKITDQQFHVGIKRALGKLNPTAAILKGPPEECSGVTETKIKTLTFSTES